MSASVIQSFRALFSPTDEQLMWRVQVQDDAQAFAELVGRWQEPIRRLCTRMIRDPHRAEDLCQEVFSRLYAHRKAFQQGNRFSTYLWRIALNHCYNELRRPHNHRETLVETSDDSAVSPLDSAATDQPTPDEQLVSRETAEVVREALATLPEQHRIILVLRHYENLKFREIAEVLNLPEGTVKTRMTEALNLLARQLRRRLGLAFAQPADSRTRPTVSWAL